MFEQSHFRYGFRVVGGRDQERRLTDFNAAFLAHLSNDDRADNDREVYLSSFLFSDDFREYLTTHGTTKGFTGPTWSSWLWFDIDREDDIDAAVTDARRLVRFLCERWQIDVDALLLFFSGSKGFHVGLPTTLWNAQPAVIFHHYAKHFATCLAGLAEVEIDTGVYDRVRLFRAPNSRHQKTGRHKRRLSAAEFFRMSSVEILTHADAPAESELPTPVLLNATTADDWADAVTYIDKQAEAVGQKRRGNIGMADLFTDDGEPTANDDTEVARLNALTLSFITEGALSGDRHRLLYSAACNLAEFGCPADLAFALLTSPGRDSGLSPSDVRRQILCGLKDGGHRCG